MTTMKRFHQRAVMFVLPLFLAAAVIIGLFAGCDEEPPPSLITFPTQGGPQPTIAALAPPNVALAGVTVVTITGANFSPVPGNNLVFFNQAQATVMSAAATQLVVKAPNVVDTIVYVKIAVQGAELFSEPFTYRLDPAVVAFGGIPNVVEVPAGITCDNQGNVYVSLQTEVGGGLGVKKVTPGGVRSDFGGTGVAFWSSLKIGPADTLFAARNLAALFSILPGGTSPIWKRLDPQNAGGIFDFDFDQQLNIWAAGSRDSVYRVARSKDVKSFRFPGIIRAVRVFQNFLYVGGLVYAADTLEKIVRFPIISSDSLGPAEIYFNFSEAFPIPSEPRVNALTFAADGDLFVGTDSAASTIVIVHPDRTAEPFYPGLLTGRAVSFGWGIGPELYVSTTGSIAAHKRILRINTERLGAPYYGRQ